MSNLGVSRDTSWQAISRRDCESAGFLHLDLRSPKSCVFRKVFFVSKKIEVSGGVDEKKLYEVHVFLPWAPKTMKDRGFGHLNTRLFTIKTSKNVGFGGPWYYIHCFGFKILMSKISMKLCDKPWMLKTNLMSFSKLMSFPTNSWGKKRIYCSMGNCGFTVL